MNRHIRGTAALLSGLLLLTACGGDDDQADDETASEAAEEATDEPDATDEPSEGGDGEDDPLAALVAAAQEEGSLTIYSGQEEGTNERVAEAFQEQYGITTEIPRIRSSDQAQRIPAEKEANAVTADGVITTNDTFVDQAYVDGLFVELTADEIPALADYPSQYVYDARAIFTLIVAVVGYNSDLLPAELVPDEWEDLLAPELQGKLILGDPRGSASWRAQMYVLDQELGRDFTTALGEQDLIVYESIVSGMEGVNAGEGWIGFPLIPSVAVPLQEAGAPIELVELYPTTGVEQSIAITDGAPHPNAARLFANWLLSEDGQIAFNSSLTTELSDPDFDKSSPLGECCGLPLPENYITVDKVDSEAAAEELNEALGLS